MRTLSIVSLSLTALVAACEKDQPVREIPLSQLDRSGGLPPGIGQSAQQPGAQGQPAATPETGGGIATRSAGIEWSVPPAWQAKPPAPMRVATYVIPPAAGDSEPGELAVFYFGAGQGGDVDANLQRWYGQIEQPDGRPSAQAAKVAHRTVNGVAVTTVSVDGTDLWSPAPMSPEKVKKPGYRLHGAIAQAPQGNVFFKLTAPQKTATAAGFESVVRSIHKS